MIEGNASLYGERPASAREWHIGCDSSLLMSEKKGPDLRAGIDATSIVEGVPLLGHCDGDEVLLVREGAVVHAVGAICPHYAAPLERGLVLDGTIRCPRHHARFALASGEALRDPSLDPIACFEVERRGDRVVVLGKRARAAAAPAPVGSSITSIVIVGAGAAGLAAAETLRAEGYGGRLTMIGAETSLPTDRPNLKTFIAGHAPEDWLALRSADAIAKLGIELVLGSPVTELDVARRRVVSEDGTTHAYDRLLLATGAEPIRLPIPGADLPHVHSLRTTSDARGILAGLASVRRAVVLGASFIGLEVASSLRARGIEVHVAAPDARPLERVLGPEVGDFVRAFHEAHGVTFHLGRAATAIDPQRVTLAGGETIPADIVIAGVGVRAATSLAERAGLQIDRGVRVDRYLETSAPGVFAAGDIARWPDANSGASIRVEHWVVAQRQGRIAARNMLGARVVCDLVPFFWTRQYDLSIAYVGHAETWDAIEIDGALASRSCRITYVRGGKRLAVATIGRELESLRIEEEMERHVAVEESRS